MHNYNSVRSAWTSANCAVVRVKMCAKGREEEKRGRHSTSSTCSIQGVACLLGTAMHKRTKQAAERSSERKRKKMRGRRQETSFASGDCCSYSSCASDLILAEKREQVLYWSLHWKFEMRTIRLK